MSKATLSREYIIKQFDFQLDSMDGDLEVVGYKFLPSEVLKSCDPIAYREELFNWLDAEIRDGQFPEEARDLV